MSVVTIIAGIILLDPACREMALAGFDRLRAAMGRESGCVAFQVYADPDSPGTLFVFEVWRSHAAFVAHFATAAMDEFTALLAACSVVDIELTRYEVVERGRI